MNGHQIENLLTLIDSNVRLSKQEAFEYVRSHQREIENELKNTGKATIPTSAGPLLLDLTELEAAAA